MNEPEKERPGATATTRTGSENFLPNNARFVNEVGGCGYDDDFRCVPVVMPEYPDDFEPSQVEATFTPEERLTYELQLAAVRIFLRIETRSCQEVADELHVTRAAVSRQYRRICRALGGANVFERALQRAKLADATKAAWRRRRGAA